MIVYIYKCVLVYLVFFWPVVSWWNSSSLMKSSSFCKVIMFRIYLHFSKKYLYQNLFVMQVFILYWFLFFKRSMFYWSLFWMKICLFMLLKSCRMAFIWPSFLACFRPWQPTNVPMESRLLWLSGSHLMMRSW